MFSFSELAAVQILLLLASVLWLVRRNDEVPILISGVLFYCSTYRFWAVTNGLDEWVTIWQDTFSPIVEAKALEVLGYIVLGQAVLIGTYMWRQKHVLKISSPVETPALLSWLRSRVILLSLLGIPLAMMLRYIASAVQRTSPSALEVSGYLLLFPLALIGISILNISLWKVGGYPSLVYKVIGAVILIAVAYLTFGPSMRFQFVGWTVGAAVIVAANHTSRTRIAVLVSVLALTVGIFSFAGSLRTEADTTGSNPAWERFAGASDANMLDGFVLLEEVYPNILDYSRGGDHLEILLHPIPRALWPNKPVGGYANKLGLNDYDNGLTGIAPSLFGSFYAEWGVAGIVILSALYGLTLATIVNYSVKLRPFANLIVRAVLCASLIPLLRGGDLAGIYAWVGMAYWPCFLLLWLKRKSLRTAAAQSLIPERFASIKTFYAALRDKRRFRKHLLS